ncbi:PREDICTED: myrosinase-binding protein 2-like [Tarenaya hassleriana]|uniref:myrosinase-binding protein 2-like n=1 Tax=Tarenaya hassleriana TaxID=28532 RepID=UPI00053C53CD|nr:PREDICTED: myrosinase-binding protein 2-like [Tarenaya hassleriana]
MSQKLPIVDVTPTVEPCAGQIRLPVVGGNGGGAWDFCGSDRITKVYVGKGHSCIGYIKIEGTLDGKFQTQEHGQMVDTPIEFAVGPDEYIVAVEGTTNYVDRYKTTLVTSLTFKTSTGRSSPTFGSVSGKKFVIQDKGRELAGFHGQAGEAIDALGGYSAVASKLPIHGGIGGGLWDLGALVNVRKVSVGNGHSCIGYIKFEYEENGGTKTNERGSIVDEPQEFALDPNEYIISVEGTTGYTNRYKTHLVTSLMFKTSAGRTSPRFGFDRGDKFVIEDKGRMIVGFHGLSGEAIDALGARSSIMASPIKWPVAGGNGGDVWDDGVYDRVRKVHVGNGRSCIGHIKFEYEKDGKIEIREHGWIEAPPVEFALNPNEYIISVEGTTNHVPLYKTTIVTSLSFKTSTGRTSPTYGFVTGEKFVLEDRGREIVGFHGQAGEAIDAIGIHSSIVSKLPIQGGKNGSAWDDGAFDGVTRVFVGDADSFIGYIKFEYTKNGNDVTYEHGTKPTKTHQFELDPYEYITSVEGTHNYVDLFKTNVITSLVFKTSRGRTSQTFGAAVGTKFVLEDNGREIVGFHGRAGVAVDALGAYAFLGTNPV